MIDEHSNLKAWLKTYMAPADENASREPTSEYPRHAAVVVNITLACDPQDDYNTVLLYAVYHHDTDTIGGWTYDTTPNRNPMAPNYLYKTITLDQMYDQLTIIYCVIRNEWLPDHLLHGNDIARTITSELFETDVSMVSESGISNFIDYVEDYYPSIPCVDIILFNRVDFNSRQKIHGTTYLFTEEDAIMFGIWLEEVKASLQ